MGSKDIGLKFGIVLTGEVFGCAYYLLNASILRSLISDLPLMLILSIPAMLAIIPTLVILKNNSDSIVVENQAVSMATSGAKDYKSIER